MPNVEVEGTPLPTEQQLEIKEAIVKQWLKLPIELQEDIVSTLAHMNTPENRRQREAQQRFEEVQRAAAKFRREHDIRLRDETDPDLWRQWQHMMRQGIIALQEWGDTGVSSTERGKVPFPLVDWIIEAGHHHAFDGYNPEDFMDEGLA